MAGEALNKSNWIFCMNESEICTNLKTNEEGIGEDMSLEYIVMKMWNIDYENGR